MSEPVDPRRLSKPVSSGRKPRRAARKKNTASLLTAVLQAPPAASSIPHDLIGLNFGWLCSDPHYGLLCESRAKDGGQKERLEALFTCFEKLCRSSWSTLEQLGKFRGGPEVLPVEEIQNLALFENMPSDVIQGSGQLVSLRFGREEYRLMAWHDDRQPEVLYLLGADWDHTLYDHGS